MVRDLQRGFFIANKSSPEDKIWNSEMRRSNVDFLGRCPLRTRRQGHCDLLLWFFRSRSFTSFRRYSSVLGKKRAMKKAKLACALPDNDAIVLTTTDRFIHGFRVFFGIVTKFDVEERRFRTVVNAHTNQVGDTLDAAHFNKNAKPGKEVHKGIIVKICNIISVSSSNQMTHWLPQSYSLYNYVRLWVILVNAGGWLSLVYHSDFNSDRLAQYADDIALMAESENNANNMKISEGKTTCIGIKTSKTIQIGRKARHMISHSLASNSENEYLRMQIMEFLSIRDNWMDEENGVKYLEKGRDKIPNAASRPTKLILIRGKLR
ncbi:hypothetical protein HUJ05_010118 [Dendroctonus ponderosae]|nr:hypothetical protein HUJ05_010118 [Dendroctonus ponderosae]